MANPKLHPSIKVPTQQLGLSPTDSLCPSSPLRASVTVDLLVRTTPKFTGCLWECPSDCPLAEALWVSLTPGVLHTLDPGGLQDKQNEDHALSRFLSGALSGAPSGASGVGVSSAPNLSEREAATRTRLVCHRKPGAQWSIPGQATGTRRVGEVRAPRPLPLRPGTGRAGKARAPRGCDSESQPPAPCSSSPCLSPHALVRARGYLHSPLPSAPARPPPQPPAARPPSPGSGSGFGSPSSSQPCA